MKNNFKFLLILLISMMVSSCTQYRYEYIPPTNYEGQECAMRCNDRRWDCSDRCEYNYSTCISQGSSGINITVNEMRQFENSNFLQQNGQQRDTKMDECKNAKYYCNNTCSTMYNDCYTSCGGQIIVHEIK